MAMLIAEGFDNVLAFNTVTAVNQRGFFNSNVGASNSLGSTTLETGRNGRGKALRLEGGNNHGTAMKWFSDLSNTLTSGCMGVAAKCLLNTGGSAEPIRITTAAAENIRVRISMDNTLTIIGEMTGTANDFSVGVTVPTTFSAWNYIELSWTPTLLKVYVNNAEVYSRAMTVPAITDVWSQVDGSIGGANSHYLLDDLYIANEATPFGDLYVRGVSLTNTDTNTGTVSGAATAHEALTSFDVDGSFVTYTAAQKTLLGITTLEENPAEFFGVSLCRSSKKNESGDIGEKFLLKTSTENSVGSVFTGVPLDWFGRRHFQSTNPATGTAFTKTVLNTTKVGVIRES